MPEDTDQVRVNKVDSCTLRNCGQQKRNTAGQGKSNQEGRQQFKQSILGNSQHAGARFDHFQSHHTQVEYKWEPITGRQTSLTTKNLNKCSNGKICLMKDRQRAEGNRTKVYAHIKHSMLMFTSETQAS